MHPVAHPQDFQSPRAVFQLQRFQRVFHRSVVDVERGGENGNGDRFGGHKEDAFQPRREGKRLGFGVIRHAIIFLGIGNLLSTTVLRERNFSKLASPLLPHFPPLSWRLWPARCYLGGPEPPGPEITPAGRRAIHPKSLVRRRRAIQR